MLIDFFSFFFKYERMFKIPKLYDKIEIITLQLLWNVSTNIAEKNLWRDNRRHSYTGVEQMEMMKVWALNTWCLNGLKKKNAAFFSFFFLNWNIKMWNWSQWNAMVILYIELIIATK